MPQILRFFLTIHKADNSLKKFPAKHSFSFIIMSGININILQLPKC